MSFINKCGQTSVLGLFQPGCPFPYIFHRTVRVVIHPPAAERELQDEENYSCQAAGCDTKLTVQCKSPVVVSHGTYYTLSNILGKAHLSVWRYFH